MTTPRIAVLLVLILSIPLASALVFPKEILFFDRLVADNEQTKIIDNDEILITGIGVTTDSDTTRAKITVQAMPDCPENAPYQENVLQCFYVSSNFDSNRISNADISFKVPKQWIDDNNFDKNALELRRYSYSWNENNNGKLSNWRALTTNLEGEDDSYYLYSSTSDGFSYFSIVGIEKIYRPEEQITAQVVQETPKPIEVPKSNIEESVTKTSSNVWLYVTLLSVLSLVISFIPASMLRKHEKVLSPFEQLTNYIEKNQDTTDEKLRQELKASGWQEWQIELAFNEVKK